METSPNLFAARTDALPSGAVLLARDGAVLSIAPGMGDVFGGSGAWATGVRLGDLVAEPDRALADAALEALRTGRTTRTEITVRLRGDAARGQSVLLALEAVHDHGETVAILLNGPERPHAPVAAQAKPAEVARGFRRLAAVAGQLGVAPWSVDLATGCFDDFSAFAAVIGWPAADPAPDLAQLVRLMHIEDRPGVAGAIDRLVSRATSSARIEFRIRHCDGHWIWCTTAAALWPDADDVGQHLFAVTCATTGFVKTARLRPCPTMGAETLSREARRDLARRRLNETKSEGEGAQPRAVASAGMHQAQDRLTALAEKAPGAMFEVNVARDGAQQFRFISARFAEIVGVDQARLQRDGTAVFERIRPGDRARMRDAARTALRAGKGVALDIRIDHPSKGARWLMYSARPKPEGDGSITWYGTILDITEWKAAEERGSQVAAATPVRQARLKALTDNAPCVLLQCRVDETEVIGFGSCDDLLPEVFGLTRAALESNPAAFGRHIPQEDFSRLHDVLLEGARNLEPVSISHRIDHPVHGLRWVTWAATPVKMPDGSVVLHCTILDVTERTAAERGAAEAHGRAHERLASLIDGATVGLFEARWHPDGRLEFPYTSGRFHDLLGYTRAQVEDLGDRIKARIHLDDRSRVRAAIAKSAKEASPFQTRFRVHHPERGVVWLKASAAAPSVKDGVSTWVAVLDDVTSDVKREQDLHRTHRAAEEMRSRIEQQALHDGLTGLANRRAFDDAIDARRALAKSGGPGDCTLVRVDLDRFKHVNDTLGHAAGDRVLARVGEVLRDCVRAGDIAARNGGDEFSILMALGAGETAARVVIDRVQHKLAEPLIHEGRQCRFGVSFGIAHSDDILETGADIHLFADAALHRAKLDGGNRTETFSPQLHIEINRDRNLAIALHEALENDELVPYFQPQISAADGSLYGAEVLLRWNHPTDGVIAPGAFMHVAEQLRLVPDIDRIMMEKSCAVLSRWRERGLVVPKLSFNVSAGRVHDPDILAFASRFARIDTRVTFELLESILVEEENQAFRDNLDFIRNAGVDIEIDDFGSGHASIIGLMEIEPTALKIDQRIVFPVVRDPRARDLVRAIVGIADALEINTVAEGVETDAHVRFLREMGCGVLQGYHYAKPLSEAQFFDYALTGHAPTA